MSIASTIIIITMNKWKYRTTRKHYTYKRKNRYRRSHKVRKYNYTLGR